MDARTKSVVIVICCFIAAFIQALEMSKEEAEKIVKARRQMECIDEVRVDSDLVVKVKHGAWKDDNPLLKQWVLCVLMKAGLMTREGVYRLDVALSNAPDYEKDHVESLIDKCLSQKAIPAPRIAYDFAKCFFMKSKGNFSYASIF